MREIRFDFINWYTILKDVLKNLWVILLAALTGFFGVRAYFNFTYRPVYSCSATVAITSTDSGSNTISNLNKTIETASTFQEMFQSSYFKEKLADMTGTPVEGTISASQISETNLMIISYSCSSPVTAYSTLVAVIENYNVITDHNFSDMVMNVIVQPYVPMAPSNPISYGYYDKLAALLCSALVLLAVMFFSYFRDTVKNESDVNEMLDAKLFSVVYHEEKNKTIKAKLRFTHSKEPLLITNILINYRFAETFRIAALKIEYLMASKKIKTLMITSCGENEGKSTTSVNLALAMASLGKKILLVDADLRKPAVYRFFAANDPDSLKGVGEVLQGHVSLNDAVIKESETGLYILCGKQKYKNSSEMLSTHRFERFLQSVREQFDLIILDTSPTALVSDSEIIASAVDAALIVVRQDIAAVPEINDMIDELSQSGVSVEGCIFNDVHVLPFSGRNHVAGESAGKEKTEVNA